MPRFLLWLGLAGLVGLTGLVLASGSGDGPEPSAVALAHGYPPGPYSEAEFSISDDAVVMVLHVTASLRDQSNRRSMRLYGDGRLEIEAGEETYTRRLKRSRMLEIVRHAVDYGLAEYNSDVAMEETKAAPGPEGRESVGVSLHFERYQRGAVGTPVSVKASFYSPESFPQVVQSRAFVDLVTVLDAEIATARREDPIKRGQAPFKTATFQLSSDPQQLILKWGSGGMAGHQQMELFGDGRLELSTRSESFTRQLAFGEMAALVRIAVDHGLAEWGTDKVLTKVRAVERGIARRMTDGTNDLVTINLEGYERGSYRRRNLKRSISFYNAGLVLSEAPEVLELQGLDALSRFAGEQLRLARGNN